MYSGRIKDAVSCIDSREIIAHVTYKISMIVKVKNSSEAFCFLMMK